MHGTPHAIAAGFAFGAAVSFTPFLGFHILIGAGLAFLFRVSVLAAAIGTIVGNPWTFPIIWVGIYNLGIQLMGMKGDEFAADGVGIAYLIDHFADVFIPMAVGGTPIAILVWLGFYFPIRSAIRRYQTARRDRRERRQLRGHAAPAAKPPTVGGTARESVS